MFQAPTPAENPAEFQRITDSALRHSGRQLRTKIQIFFQISDHRAENPGKFAHLSPTNYANSAHFAVD